MVSRKKKKRKQVVTVEPWPTGEVSTRNCRHCLAPNNGVDVKCRKGHPMAAKYDRHRHSLTYNGVIRVARLVAPCLGCPDFDNDWE